MADYAAPDDVANAWRPLSTREASRAAHWLEVVSRRIRRRWPNVDDRLTLPADDPHALDAKDVRDVAVAVVIAVLAAPQVPGAKSWQVSSGSESRTVTLGDTPAFDPSRGLDALLDADWIVSLFDDQPAPTGTVLPVYSMPAPAPGRFESLFQWKEGGGAA